jgi:hypothetical protein
MAMKIRQRGSANTRSLVQIRKKPRIKLAERTKRKARRDELADILRDEVTEIRADYRAE